jgi:hypothetical protein
VLLLIIGLVQENRRSIRAEEERKEQIHAMHMQQQSQHSWHRMAVCDVCLDFFCIFASPADQGWSKPSHIFEVARNCEIDLTTPGLLSSPISTYSRKIINLQEKRKPNRYSAAKRKKEKKIWERHNFSFRFIDS